jgi:hypothetical protein
MSASQVLNYIRSDPGLSQAFQSIPDVVFTSAAGFLGLLCNLIFYPIFGLLGGLIGAAVFKK